MKDANEQTPALAGKGIRAGYNGSTVLQDLTVSIQPGESVALIGPNGCGKSTFFRVVAGLLRPEAGKIELYGEEIGKHTVDARIRHGIGYLKQTKNIFAGLTVEENLSLAGGSMASAERLDQRTKTLLGTFPALGECLKKRAGLLSGGQRQSLAAAMVMMRPARLFLLDEPVAGLSPGAGNDLLQALNKLREEEEFAMVIVEHRLRQVQPHVSRVLVMREGRIVDDTTDTGRMLDAAWLAGHYLNGNGHHESTEAPV